MIKVHFPSVQIDEVREDPFDATHASVTGTETGPFDLGVGGNFEIDFDLIYAINIDLAEAQFEDIRAATVAEVVAAISSQLTHGTIVVESGCLTITSDECGSASAVRITDASLAASSIFGWTDGGLVVGTDASSAFELFNRNPEPDETDVPRDSHIALNMQRGDWGEVHAFYLRIWVNDVLAFDGNTFVNGFSGGRGVDNTLLWAEFWPAEEFENGSTVSVRVYSDEVTPALDETYSFGVVDERALLIEGVQGQNTTTLRVVFNKPVLMVDPAADDDALNPTNYTFERKARPSVDFVAVSVARIDDWTVDITTDIEPTFGAPYMLVAANIADGLGNVFTAPDNTCDFFGYAPPFPQGRRFRLDDFVPQVNKSEDATEELRLMLAVLQEPTNLLLSLIDRWLEILDVDVAEEAYLDAMLLDLGNPFTEFHLSVIDKRRLLHVLVAIYQLKGTEIGIVDVIRFFMGLEVTIETFNGEGWTLTCLSVGDTEGDELNSVRRVAPENPALLGPSRRGLYSFRILVPDVILTAEQRTRITEIANLMKPERTHLVGIIDATPEVPIDHVELGLSALGTRVALPGANLGEFRLHSRSAGV